MLKKKLINKTIMAAIVITISMSMVAGCGKSSQTSSNDQGNNTATTQAVKESTSANQTTAADSEHVSVAVQDAEGNTTIVDGVVSKETDGTTTVTVTDNAGNETTYNVSEPTGDNQEAGAAYQVSAVSDVVSTDTDNGNSGDSGAVAADTSSSGSTGTDNNSGSASSEGSTSAPTPAPTPTEAPTPAPTEAPTPAPVVAPYELTQTETFLRQVGASNRDSDTAENVYTKLCAIGDGLVSGSYSESQAVSLIGQIKDDTNADWWIYQSHAKIFTASGKYECNSTSEKQALSAVVGNNIGNYLDDNKYMRVFYNPNTDTTTFYYVGLSGTAVHN